MYGIFSNARVLSCFPVMLFLIWFLWRVPVCDHALYFVDGLRDDGGLREDLRRRRKGAQGLRGGCADGAGARKASGKICADGARARKASGKGALTEQGRARPLIGTTHY
jgi:hypothetical protein